MIIILIHLYLERRLNNELLRIDNESGAIALYTEMKALPVGELTGSKRPHIRLKTTDKWVKL